MYRSLLRPLLFQLDAEKAHHLTTGLLRTACRMPGIPALLRKRYQVQDKVLERKLFGLPFPNPVGLAAGFDKNATLWPALQHLGFGFIEIGTVTPRPQRGNPRPRLFRLRSDRALVNRMGFNNDGAQAVARRLEKRPDNLIIGGNIGKNKDTPNEQAPSDYRKVMQRLSPYVDYFVVNVSSPNTPGLRELQHKALLRAILDQLQHENQGAHHPRPLLLKIAPDLHQAALDDILALARAFNLDGLVATNTTISRDGLQADPYLVKQIGAGGLSGKPLEVSSNRVISTIHRKTKGELPIIGVGGITSPSGAYQKLQAGASLVQLYTGWVYEGPQLVRQINEYLLQQGVKRL